MEDGFEATFVVDLALEDVWKAITVPFPAASPRAPHTTTSSSRGHGPGGTCGPAVRRCRG